MSTFMVTGGAGYIGSHMCIRLLEAGHEVIVIDNLSNSSMGSIDAIRRLTGKRLHFYPLDLRDKPTLQTVFNAHAIEAVLHFAGLKAVAESVSNPTLYYDNNVSGSLVLVEQMAKANVKTLVFSSSATVYGMTDEMPITEQHPTAPINPYGRSKLMIEEMLRDVCVADDSWRISLLRYFNPVGAHLSGQLGEDPNGIPNNLLPSISQVAVGKRNRLKIFGNDYPTPDGTCIRDYIHVQDLVAGHLCALEYLSEHPGCCTHNLGTGNGYSVLEVLRAFETASGMEVPADVVGRRPGDAAESYADASKANAELGWKAQFDLRQMCEDAWRWQSTHPEGFRKAS